MKIDMKYEFKNIMGKVQREADFERDEDDNPKRDRFGNLIPKLGDPFTLKSACLNVLTNPPVDSDDRTGRPVEVSVEHNLMLADLAQRIYKSNDLIDLEVDEIKLLKDSINKKYNAKPLIITQAFKILDPTQVENKKKS